jgi:hypothetical protein
MPFDEMKWLYQEIDRLQGKVSELERRYEGAAPEALALFGLKPYETYTLGEVESIKKAIEEALK